MTIALAFGAGVIVGIVFMLTTALLIINKTDF